MEPQTPGPDERAADDKQALRPSSQLRLLSLGLGALRIGPLLILIIMVIVVSIATPLFLMPR
jgi:hypothetical protein